MEPWDGPASIAFTDGTVIGAVLDRNGLRPSRYYVTKDDLVIMASEVGVLDVPPEDVLVKERLHPGKIFLVDTVKGRIVDDEEIKRELAAQHPYRRVARCAHLIDINDLPPARAEQPEHETVFKRQQAFGYTQEDLRFLIAPMATNGEEPVGSMGTDTALAVLSDKPRLLYDYFKQLFAQVTNPPLDAIREELVTDMGVDDRARAQPAQARAGVVPADHDQVPDHPQRARREAAASAAELAVPIDDAVDAVRSGSNGRRRRARAGDGRSVPAGERGRRRRLRHPDPVGPRRRPAAGADSEPAGHRRRAPPPGARGHAHALRAGRRVRRRARSASRVAAARLRRRRGEPVRRVRDDRRHDPARAC